MMAILGHEAGADSAKRLGQGEDLITPNFCIVGCGASLFFLSNSCLTLLPNHENVVK